MGTATLLVIAAYLWGSVPSAYLVARYLKGIDIRSYGSGNLGASNVMQHVGARTGLALGAFDMLGKGALTVVAARLLDQNLSVQVWMGLAVVAGHNWSAYLRLTGGRGIATSLGAVLGLGLLWELPVWLAFISFGRFARRDTALWSLVGALALPLVALVAGRPAEIVWMLSAMVLLMVAKRATANWERPQTEAPSIAKVLRNRILWDRDVSRKEQWTVRRPPPGQGM